MHPNKTTFGPWVQEWLTTGRFSTYIRAAGNDEQRAFDLYQWNTGLSAVFLHDFAHLEVALRNAFHRELGNLVGPTESWMSGPTCETLFPRITKKNHKTGETYDPNKWIRKKLSDSRQKFRCNSQETRLTGIQEGRIVADLTFGVWVDLASPRFESSLWTLALRKAFSKSASRKEVYDSLRVLNDFRNRIAHHEPLIRQSNKVHREVFWVLSMLSSDIHKHVSAHSDVAKLLASRP